jgi:rRNA-processing protein FCF1
MKAELKKYISEIFSTLQITQSFEVFECKNDVMPEWTSQVSLTHEFLIYCKQLSDTEKLQRFLGKNLSRMGENIYWFEGEQILMSIQPGATFDSPAKAKYDCLKTNTSLPAWLDSLIFNQLHAEYSPDFERFDYNLDLTEDENKKYLGTYFPRSYTEAFCIFDNIFQNRVYQKVVFPKSSLNILSIGCGTGGDLIGLLTIIEKYCNTNITLNIWAIDGNKNALNILTEIVGKFKTITCKKINLNILQSIFNAKVEESIAKDEINKRQYDFIISFKMITEIISAGKGNADNSYFNFFKRFTPLLSDRGLYVLLDVTTMQEHNYIHNPILMNNQANKALQELQNHKTLLPLSCNIYEKNCTSDCFTQQQFTVSHSKRTNDISKVTYRIITNIGFANQLGMPDISAEYLIGRNKSCYLSDKNEKKADAFLLGSGKEDFSKKEILNKPKVVGIIDLSQFEKKKKTYIIDTNVFIECPDIIYQISKNDVIILSAKVIDELDNLKIKLPEKLKDINTAFRIINQNMSKRKITMESADLKLLPEDFNKKSPDNFILAVALKHKDNNSVLLTSDNGLQVKAKGMNIKTLSLKCFQKTTKK